MSDMRESLMLYISSSRQASELTRTPLLRLRHNSIRIETLRKQWESSGPHSPADMKSHNALMRECAASLRVLSSEMRSIADDLLLRNDEKYDRALSMCDDPEREPVAILDFLRQDDLQRIAEFPTYEEYFNRLDDAYAELETFVGGQSNKGSVPTSKKSRRN
jgi:hypothetical protein